MDSKTIVWSVDATNRPDLEVDIDLVAPAAEVPNEVALAVADDDDELSGGWFVDADAPVFASHVIFDAAPHGYERAYRAAS